MTNKTLTDITLIIDASPSMAPQQKETIQGVNTFIQDQLSAAVAAEESVKINLVTFSTGHQALDALTLNDWNYRPAYGNGTALYDAVGNTINAIGQRLRALPETKRPGKVLVVIVTDGEENTSRTFAKALVKSMIKRQQDEYKWDFVFLGANQDAWAVGAGLGFYGNKTMAFNNNVDGFKGAFASASSYATRSVAAKSLAEYVGNSFTVGDVALQAAAGLDVGTLSVPDTLKTPV
jgi:uncharacterized protein YegL